MIRFNVKMLISFVTQDPLWRKPNSPLNDKMNAWKTGAKTIKNRSIVMLAILMQIHHSLIFFYWYTHWTLITWFIEI